MIENNLYRFDTRIYFDNHSPGSDDECIGAIIGKNPGSAKPIEMGKLAKLDQGSDRMLPYVRNRFEEGYKLAGKEISNNGYVQVWNLFYLCNPDLDEAKKTARNITNQPVCETENNLPGLVWFAWGGDDNRLNSFKQRFLDKSYHRCFYYDYKIVAMVGALPSLTDSVKHPQGLSKASINDYLSRVL